MIIIPIDDIPTNDPSVCSFSGTRLPTLNNGERQSMTEPTSINPDEIDDIYEIKATESNYSRRKFYTKSRDDKGSRDAIRVSCPPYLSGGISALIQSHDVPQYRTREDFMRDAAFHRLKEVHEWLGREEDIKRDVREFKQNQEEQILARMEYEDDSLTKFETGLQSCGYKKDFKTMKELLDHKKTYVDDLPEPYKTKTIELIERFSSNV